MKKKYINPIIEFHTASLQTFMQNVFSENEPDTKERGKDFEENVEDENNGWTVQKSLW